MTNQQSKLTGRPMVVFGEDWGGHPSSTQHIVEVLKEQRDIIWINSIGLRQPKFSLRDFKRLLTKVSDFFSKRTTATAKEANEVNSHIVGHAELSHQFTVISPLVIPCATNPLLVWVNRCLLKLQLFSALKRIEKKSPIVWTSLPTAVDYLTLFKSSANVYYCGDDFDALAGVDHEVVGDKEKKLVGQVKYIFTASEQLKHKFPLMKTVVIPHGVDTKLFSTTKAQWPEDLPKGKPIAGFYGSISTWLDQEIVSNTASILTDWNFVFIGHVECDISLLQQHKNIYFLTAKPHAFLPQYLAHWQVAMLPFKDNEQIRKCNPLKLREYLASGTPVVATDFNALEQYRDLIHVASPNKPFHTALLMANAELAKLTAFKTVEVQATILPMLAQKQARMDSVKSASWDQRANEVESYLLQC